METGKKKGGGLSKRGRGGEAEFRKWRRGEFEGD